MPAAGFFNKNLEPYIKYTNGGAVCVRKAAVWLMGPFRGYNGII